jgi:hypothetical protein
MPFSEDAGGVADIVGHHEDDIGWRGGGITTGDAEQSGDEDLDTFHFEETLAAMAAAMDLGPTGW